MTRPANTSTQNSTDSIIPTFSSPSFHINIAPFTGEPDVLEFFISQVHEVAVCNRWTDAQSFAFAKSKLQGPALTFYIQKSEYHPIKNSVELYNVLRAQFKKENHCRSISEFNSFSMIPGESMSSLAHRLDTLAPKAHSTIKDMNALNSIKYNKFISIIPNNYRIHILQNSISSYDDAVEKSKILQECEKNNEFICQTSANTSHMNELKSEVNSLKESIAHLNVPKPSFPKTFHGKHNHFQKHNFRSNDKHKFNYKNKSRNNFRKPFFNKKHARSQSSQQPGDSTHNSQENASITCQFCGISGHGCRFCPTFKLYFQPRNAPHFMASSSSFRPSRSTSTLCPSSSSSAEMPLGNEIVHNINASNLDPNATPFEFHPNW